jgi:nucleoside-diphosphate-sugar epimerase
MKVLFIGGTGIISSACSQLAVERGFELYLLNRGETHRPAPEGVEVIRGDIRAPEAVRELLDDRRFDVVVDWVAYTPEHIETDLALFRGRVGQYIFISSASVYQPPPSLPITESTPTGNPLWGYAQAKVDCEDRLVRAQRTGELPVTIVRPSHTYDRTLFPVRGGYTMVDRMRRGKPVIVPGDGTSLWVMTHHLDFARGFLGLLGNPRAIGEAVHITSDEALTWNQIYTTMAQAAGATPHLVHIPSDLIAAFNPDWGGSLLGDKSHSKIFDNTKIRRLVPDFVASIPYARGAREVQAWYDADPARQVIDEKFSSIMDHILSAYESAWPVV